MNWKSGLRPITDQESTHATVKKQVESLSGEDHIHFCFRETPQVIFHGWWVEHTQR
jgi:hypothetical protein